MVAVLLSSASIALADQARPEIVPIDPLTATISGRVTTETGGPIRRAEVRATSNGGLTRFATTDPEGRFVVRDLPAGAFTLHISKSGFVPLYFGQRRPFERRQVQCTQCHRRSQGSGAHQQDTRTDAADQFLQSALREVGGPAGIWVRQGACGDAATLAGTAEFLCGAADFFVWTCDRDGLTSRRDGFRPPDA